VIHTHITYYPKEEEKKKKKEKNIVSSSCKEEREEDEERKQEIYFYAPIGGMWFCLTPFSHFLNACMQVSLSTTLLRRRRTNSNTILHV